ncbi:unnamed protein product [Clonostachys rosea f. rosea IK726]|uniref:Uncharacterized protein n=1 Tax=Clonostachys rosea f. rosea IK726 TaxID=1349383 RepID=A0ACA9TGL3_BIOOC|nr:unnamed protein product [Clonostachys rosea f. rosea IK726]
MSYNQYGRSHQYGAPPGYGGYPGGNAPPGMGGPPGPGGPPPGMSSAPGMSHPPGMAPPPGLHQYNAPQTNRPSGLPPNFQAPPNMPNINFNAPVIRLGTAGQGKMNTPTQEPDRPSHGGSGRPGLGMERGGQDQGRQAKETPQVLIPPTSEEKLRTIFLHQLPESLSVGGGVERLLGGIGKLRRWDPFPSVLDSSKPSTFGFALFEDAQSLSTAIKLLHDEIVYVPVKRQSSTSTETPEDDTPYEEFEKTKVEVAVDPSTSKYIESWEEENTNGEEREQRLAAARSALKTVVKELFYPPAGTSVDAEGDVAMKNQENGENVEIVNINIAQDDELADIPAEMREVVSQEIAAFRERSIQRDMERLKKEEEMEEIERQRSGAGARSSRLASPPVGAGANSMPLGPRGVPNAPLGPKGQSSNGRVAFVNGGISNTEYSVNQDDEDTDADDEELYRRYQSKQKAEADKSYLEAERKWANRERSRQAALEREQAREKQEAESLERRKEEQLEREKSWDDERESSRKSHPYYRDHANWVRKRVMDRGDEESRDESDRRAEQDEKRREQANADRARGMADSFLEQQAQELEQQQQTESAPQPFKLSLGAAAQKAQASRGGAQRRTIAEVEGLLDDEEADTSTKRQLIPIQFEPTSGSAGMTDEEISQAVRSLAQEIPSDKEGLWSWEVKWDFMDDSVIRSKLRPFVEKKIVEYLGVQEEMLVETVEDHLRNHGTAAALADELEGALDEEAEDLVKKLWRMVIFFTESEKRGLPA